MGNKLGSGGKIELQENKEEGIESSISNSASVLPHHLTSDILLRLQAESVVRSRYVSKLWSSITTDPYFTDTFATQSSTRPSLLMLIKKRGKLFVFSFPQYNQNSNESYSSAHHVDSYHMNYPNPNSCFSASTRAESVNGLICFRDDSIIWNPSIRQMLTLPKPDKSLYYKTMFLGYDPIQGKHKVLCYLYCGTESDEECRVLTLGSAQESWRSIKTNHNHRTYSNTYGICINGFLYYEATLSDHPDNLGIIMSFGVTSEKFDMIKLPGDNTDDDDDEQQFNEYFVWGTLLPYEGKLACVSQSIMNDCGIALWILEDAKKHEWSCKPIFPSFLHPGRSLRTRWMLRGITDAGEFIYVPTTILKSFYILYYDPKRNTSRKVEFKGVADEGFRFSNGLGSKRLSAFCIPNHIESLMSLLQLK